jgi:hypothetical protein
VLQKSSTIEGRRRRSTGQRVDARGEHVAEVSITRKTTRTPFLFGRGHFDGLIADHGDFGTAREGLQAQRNERQPERSTHVAHRDPVRVLPPM